MNKKPSNWIQGLSVQERKKQGITTVMPPKKTTKKIHYDAGQVNVEVNHSHMDKLRILHMTMHLWKRNNGQVPIDSQQGNFPLRERGRLYEADLHLVEELVDRGREGREILTKKEMLDMNILFKTYGGKRVTK